MMQKNRRILLTGSGGFIGSNIKKSLQNKYIFLTPRSFELNLLDKNAVSKFFKENEIDFIINCSSTGGYRELKDKETTVEDNLSMVENIIKNKKENVKMILFGSGAMYDRKRDLDKVKEEEIGKHIPSELYGKSKMLIAEKIKNRNDVLCLNIFGCYGYNEKQTRFPTYTILQNLKQEPVIINQNAVFDYLFIDDLVKIIEFFIENKSKQNILNITPNESISLEEIARIINEISGYKNEIIIKNPVMNYKYTGDNSRFLKEVPDFKFTSYKNGLKKLFYNLKNDFIFSQ